MSLNHIVYSAASSSNGSTFIIRQDTDASKYGYEVLTVDQNNIYMAVNVGTSSGSIGLQVCAYTLTGIKLWQTFIESGGVLNGNFWSKTIRTSNTASYIKVGGSESGHQTFSQVCCGFYLTKTDGNCSNSIKYNSPSSSYGYNFDFNGSYDFYCGRATDGAIFDLGGYVKNISNTHSFYDIKINNANTYVYSGGIGYSGSNQVGIIVKFSVSGVLTWQRIIDYSTNAYITNILVDSEDSVIVLSSVNVISKVNSSGSMVWSRKLSHSTLTLTITNISVDTNNCVYASGQCGTNGFLIKFDSNGNTLWQKVISNTSFSVVFKVNHTTPQTIIALSSNAYIDIIKIPNDFQGTILDYTVSNNNILTITSLSLSSTSVNNTVTNMTINTYAVVSYPKTTQKYVIMT